MSNPILYNITNNFLDVRLVSLASWRAASEFIMRDRGGPYVVLQEGYDPEDPLVRPDEFILGRAGKWLSLGLFFRMPINERREEFVFNTAAEVMQMMEDLPSKPQILRAGAPSEAAPATQEPDEMMVALQAGKNKAQGTAKKS